MKNRRKKLPTGIESFEEMILGGYCYGDKTDMIGDLLNNGGKVNLFTRPAVLASRLP